MKQVSMYLAGGLFHVSERSHNARLEKNLITAALKKDITLKITLPQRTALTRFISNEKGFDIPGIVSDCERDVANSNYALFNLDGPDADSGTAVELGIARAMRLAYEKLANPKGEIHPPKIITYRTDFRTDLEKEVGVNAMLRPEGSIFIYHPCFIIESRDFDKFYKELAGKIIDKIE